MGEIIIGDTIEKMSALPDKSVDMILADLPYGKTRNTWDKVIPFDLLWGQYLRVAKDNAAIVLTASQPFTSALINSNLKMFRYCWVWEKTHAKGHLNANERPMTAHEDIVVFYKNQPIYNPQKTSGHKPVNSYTKHTGDGSNYGKTKIGISGGGNTDRFPRTVLKFKSDTQKSSLHPTQKPVALMEYFIKTYTNPGAIVLDNVAGSGTVGEACENTGRQYILIEADKAMEPKIRSRLKYLKRMEETK